MTYEDTMDWLKDQADDAAWDHERRLEIEKEYWKQLELIDDLMSVVQDYAEAWYREDQMYRGEIPYPMFASNMNVSSGVGEAYNNMLHMQGQDWCSTCDQPWDELCQNYGSDCKYVFRAKE